MHWAYLILSMLKSMILFADIKRLIRDSESILGKLEEIYSFIPPTKCERMTHCCSLLPEATLLESLLVFRWIMVAPVEIQTKILQKSIYYFFMNPVEIVRCPFLEDKDCLIYNQRFFGCRAYGLWSMEYYEILSNKSRCMKDFVRKQWEKLGIPLPHDVMDFYVPYCPNVKIFDSKNKIDDQVLLGLSDSINALSQRFGHWHDAFMQVYFSDLSFLLASMIYGIPESIRLKFDIVSDIVKTGNKQKIDKALREIKIL